MAGTTPPNGGKNWWARRSPLTQVIIIIFALIAVAGIVSSGKHSDSNATASSSAPSSDSGSSSSSDSSSAPEPKSNIYLVAGKSFCIATGVDDAFTGDGHVTFFLTFKNSGDKDGSVSATPVRHYDDGGMNESVLDMVSADVPAGSVRKFHTDAMKYKAHEHDITDCGVRVDGRDEVSINAIQ